MTAINNKLVSLVFHQWSPLT